MIAVEQLKVDLKLPHSELKLLHPCDSDALILPPLLFVLATPQGKPDVIPVQETQAILTIPCSFKKGKLIYESLAKALK